MNHIRKTQQEERHQIYPFLLNTMVQLELWISNLAHINITPGTFLNTDVLPHPKPIRSEPQGMGPRIVLPKRFPDRPVPLLPASPEYFFKNFQVIAKCRKAENNYVRIISFYDLTKHGLLN